MPSAYRFKNPHEELGFVPLALAAAPAVGGIVKGIGGLFKKKKKAAPAAPPKPEAARAGSVSKSKSAGGPIMSSAPQVAGLAAVPTDVKLDALAALKSYQKTNQASAAKQAALVKKLAKVVQPQVAAMKAQVAKQALKQQVTSEHNKIVKSDERWARNDEAHKAIMAKFDQLESALKASHGTTQRVFKIYGVNA